MAHMRYIDQADAHLPRAARAAVPPLYLCYAYWLKSTSARLTLAILSYIPPACTRSPCKASAF